MLREQALSQTDVKRNSTKAAIVTGGNAGIGLETCYFLMRAGYTVVIGTEKSCRTPREVIPFAY